MSPGLVQLLKAGKQQGTARLLICPGTQHEGRACWLCRLPDCGVLQIPMLLLEAQQCLHLQMLLGTIEQLCRDR